MSENGQAVAELASTEALDKPRIPMPEPEAQAASAVDDAEANPSDVPASEPAPGAEPADASETPAPQADAPKVGSVDQTPEQLQRQLDAIESKGRVVSNLLANWECAKAEAASAKKFYDEAVVNLLDLIRRHNAPLPLFDKAEISAGSTSADPIAGDVATAAETTPETWRSVLIADLTPALKKGKLKALAENNPPITTMGEMADWQASKGDWWVKDIDGFGPGGAEQYAAAADAYWAANPQTSGQLTETAENTAEIDTPSLSSDGEQTYAEWAADAQRIIDNPNCFILISPDPDHGWVEAHGANIGKLGMPAGIRANHPTREAAVSAAADAIHDWIQERSAKLRGDQPGIAKAILAELEGIDVGVRV